jgi:hypothetical protein
MPVIATLTAPSSGGIDDFGDEFGMASSSQFSHPAALLEAAAWKDCQVTPPTGS